MQLLFWRCYSDKLTAEFGKGFDESNLRKMRQFYCVFPIRDALRPELSWTHYRKLMQITDEKERAFYTEESVKSASKATSKNINPVGLKTHRIFYKQKWNQKKWHCLSKH